MNSQFMLNIMGNDKAHLLKDLSNITHELGGKWLKSKFTRLEGQIAGIIKVDLPDSNKADLLKRFEDAGELQLLISDVATNVASGHTSLELKIEATDKPGLVSEITQVLADEGVVISKMENHRISVPELGSLVFTAEMSLEVPADVEQEQLIEEIRQLNEELRVEAV